MKDSQLELDVIGCVVNIPAAMDKVLWLKPENFTGWRKDIWKCLQNLHRRQNSFHPVIILDEMRRLNIEDAPLVLAEMIARVNLDLHIQHWGLELIERSIKRSTIELLRDLYLRARGDGREIDATRIEQMAKKTEQAPDILQWVAILENAFNDLDMEDEHKELRKFCHMVDLKGKKLSEWL